MSPSLHRSLRRGRLGTMSLEKDMVSYAGVRLEPIALTYHALLLPLSHSMRWKRSSNTIMRNRWTSERMSGVKACEDFWWLKSSELRWVVGVDDMEGEKWLIRALRPCWAMRCDEVWRISGRWGCGDAKVTVKERPSLSISSKPNDITTVSVHAQRYTSTYEPIVDQQTIASVSIMFILFFDSSCHGRVTTLIASRDPTTVWVT